MKVGLFRLAFMVIVCLIPVSGLALTVQVPGDYSTIQSAINNAPDGSTIIVAPGTYAEALGCYNLNKTLYVKSSAGAANTIIHGGGIRFLLKILNAPYAGKDITFDGFTFTLGRGDSNFSPVTIEDARPTFLNCNFENNSSPIKGGAVLVYGASASPTFSGCNFRNNQTDRFGGAVLINGSSAQAAFIQCLFEDNTNRTPNASNVNSGGALQFTEAGGSVVSCIFRRNSSTYTGGAVMILTQDYSRVPDRVALSYCHFIDNFSAPGSSPPPTPTEGGAIHIEANVIVEIKKSYFENNYAMAGGAISNYRALLTVSDSVFDNNRAIGTNYLGYGGAIGVLSYNPTSSELPDATLTVTNTMIRNCRAPVGGAISMGGNIGWNLPDNRRAQITLNNVVIENCSATKSDNSYGNGGALNLDFAHLTANGLFLLNNYADQFGGGIVVNQNTLVTLNNSYIIGNKASSGPSIFVADPASPSPILNNTIKAYNQGDATAALAVLKAIPSVAINGNAYLAYILAPYAGSPSITPHIGVVPNRGGYAVGTAVDPITSNTSYHLISSNYPTQSVEVILSPVTTMPATKVTMNSAVLNGTVNPDGLSATCYFQWGTNTAYGNTTPSQSAGSGTSSVAMSANLTGLTPRITYHYRLVCTNSAGTDYGSDMIFKTVVTLPFLMLLLN